MKFLLCNPEIYTLLLIEAQGTCCESALLRFLRFAGAQENGCGVVEYKGICAKSELAVGLFLPCPSFFGVCGNCLGGIRNSLRRI